MLNRDWFAAANDEIHPRIYPAGTVLTGELLERATALGLVDAVKAENGAPHNKAGRKK